MGEAGPVLTRRRLLRIGAMGGLAALGGGVRRKPAHRRRHHFILGHERAVTDDQQPLRPQRPLLPRPPAQPRPPTTLATTTVPPARPRRPSHDAAPTNPGRLENFRLRADRTVVQARHPAYPVDLELYDPVYDSISRTGIAYCANASDVARSLSFAREHGLPLAPRSGGHSYAGYSTTTGLVIDVSLMSHVAVKPATSPPSVPGTRLIDVYSDLRNRGSRYLQARARQSGNAGLALGGGIGVTGRLHGLTCDNIVGLKVVTADGRAVIANASTNSDLFWAVPRRGRGQLWRS